MEDDQSDLYIVPFPGARTCVNGTEVKERTKIYNDDRILWGSNHFFRVNCPKKSDSGKNQLLCTPNFGRNISCFFFLFQLSSTKNVEKVYLDECLECALPKRFIDSHQISPKDNLTLGMQNLLSLARLAGCEW